MSKSLYHNKINRPDAIAFAFRQAESAARKQDIFKPVEIIVRFPQVKRSITQNSLSHLWYADAEEQGDDTRRYYKSYCKLHFGIPILRRESKEYREKYDALVKGKFTYEEKLALMDEPMPWPVTSAMNKILMTEYLDAVYSHFTGLGFQLTVPGGEFDWSKYPEASAA